MADPRTIVNAYMEHLQSKNLTEQRKLLRDDLHFQGPFDEFNRADDYNQALSHLVPMLDDVEIKKVLSMAVTSASSTTW